MSSRLPTLVRLKVLFLLAVTLFTGCGQETGVEPVDRPAAAVVVSRSSAETPPAEQLTEEEMQVFVDRFSGAVLGGDVRAANACVDWSSIADLSLEGLLDNSAKSKEFRRGFKQGVLGSIHAEGSYMGQLVKEAALESGGYELVRLHTVDGRPYALFRLYGDDGLNYHDYLLGKRGGEVVAKDVYVFITGEHFSKTIRRLALPAVQQIGKNWLQKLASSDKALLENYEKFGRMAELINQGNGREAMRLYKQLPRELRLSKVVLIQRYHAAGMIDNEEVVAAIDAYEKAFPDDPGLPLLTIDALIIRKEFDKALAAIDKLDAAVGGDGYLNEMRASIELDRGDREAATRYARAFIADKPGDIERRWLLLGVLIQGDDHAATYEALAEMDELFEIEWNDLRESPNYAGFVASPEGKRWLSEHGFADE